MTPWPAPASVGDPVETVDTPALIVELDPLERNLARMADAARRAGVALRPHAKMHKCAALALRQMALGAVGVCSQKVAEAEALVDAGVNDVLISNEVVGAKKLERLACLAGRARIAVCVDDAGNVADLGRAVRAAGTKLGVLVEIDVGARRCGVAPGAQAVALAQAIHAEPGLVFGGLQAYQGRAQHLRLPAARQAAIEAASAAVRETREALLAAGLACPHVTGAGTGTYMLEAASGVYTELQAGSYAFMDADYALNQQAAPFEHALFVLTTVMSRAPDRAVLDAGLKAHSIDSGMPVPSADARGLPLAGLEVRRVSDEHSVLVATTGSLPTLGAKLRLIPGHIDPTINLHDWIIAVRNNRVEELWPVVARGAHF
ncbi:MAG: DSD1 family PLP-dependent enzyme [Burkholderiales bacterium]